MMIHFYCLENVKEILKNRVYLANFLISYVIVTKFIYNIFNLIIRNFIMKYLWDIINSRLIVIVIVLLFISFIWKELVFFANDFTNTHQNFTWERDKKHIVLKQEIQEAKKTIEKINFLISQRAYSLQKVHWKIESYNLDESEIAYKNYEKVKDKWNEEIRVYRNKLKRLVDEDLAYSLLNSNTDKKRSVHNYFAKTHELTKDWLRCLRNGSKCSDFKDKQNKAHKSLTELYNVTDLFIDKSYSIFLKKYKSIKEFPRNKN